MDLLLEGQVAVVTGASRGLGLAICRAFAAEKMAVLAAARTADALDALVAEHPGQVAAAPCDVRDPDQVAGLADLALSTFGRLDVVVNNAGIAPAARFLDADLDVWRTVLDVNVLAAVALCRAAGPTLVAQGHGKVINVASTSGLRGKPTLAAYSASKGALLRFTEALAGEWAAANVQVNAIAPGAFATSAQDAVLSSPDVLARRLRKIPAGRMGDAAEIGPLACYLASPRSDFVTGACYVIDGGEASKL
ncbi:MAG TPA: glucose 1-dehydrogenase [Acidimicrobiales bacterium]|nr:glucose 1-dehydrogenase [Acidimicrobiales bacterium]